MVVGYETAGLNAAADGVAAAGTWISGHSVDAPVAGGNEITSGTGAGGRQQTSWAAAAAAEREGSQVSIDIAGGVTVRSWGIWSAQTAGTCLGTWQLDAPEAFGSAGVWKHTPTIGPVTNPA